MSSRTFRSVLLNLEQLEDRDLPSSTLSGFIFNDANNNGVQDAGEQGLASVLVRVQGVDSHHHSVNRTQHTDASGFYNFANLAKGQYTISAVDPSDYTEGSVSVGSAGGTAAENSISRIALGNNVSGTGYNFNELAKSAGWTSIDANFNRSRIRAGSTVWFSSEFSAQGISATSTTTLTFTNQTISYTLNGSTVTVAVPDSTVVFSPTATTATTTFDAASNSWTTTLPSSLKGQAFLGGVEVAVPNGLPGGIKDVTWKGQLTTDTAGVSVNWKWNAEVFSKFSSDYNALNVKPVASPSLSAYHNHDQAGAPEAFERFDARGALNESFTNGERVVPMLYVPAVATTASLSGFIRNSDTGLGMGAVINLEDAAGNIIASTTSNSDGSYSFGSLPVGSYKLQVVTSMGVVSTQVGTVNGALDGTDLGGGAIGSISLAAGNNGINYNFNLVQLA